MSPDFRELVGDDVTGDERERLQRAHDLLVAAGPPSELPPHLEHVPEPAGPARIFSLPRRRLGATLIAAAAVLAVAFGGGYLAGHSTVRKEAKAAFSVPMEGTAAAPAARASLVLLDADSAGNWPVDMRIKGLEQLSKGGYYELYLTKHGKLGPSCGTFIVHSGVTSVRLNAPYKLKEYNGWVVVRHRAGEPDHGPILLRTSAI